MRTPLEPPRFDLNTAHWNKRRGMRVNAGTAIWVIVGMILLQLAFWGGVIYVALHFLLKWW